MGQLTLQDIRTQVRDTLELDSTDIPDGILDLFVQEGFDRIARDHSRWTFYEDDFEFTTVAGQRAYAFEDIDPTLASVDGIEHDSWMCMPIAHQLAQGQYAGSTVTGTPTNFSIWHGKLHLWPTPDGELTVSVRGYREPADWIASGSGATPDVPTEFHPLIVLWALHRAYLQQDDQASGQMLRQMFNEQFKVLREDYLRTYTAEPSIIGATHGRTHSMLPPRLRYPFDY